jgi:hypothetical protein
MLIDASGFVVKCLVDLGKGEFLNSSLDTKNPRRRKSTALLALRLLSRPRSQALTFFNFGWYLQQVGAQNHDPFRCPWRFRNIY